MKNAQIDPAPTTPSHPFTGQATDALSTMGQSAKIHPSAIIDPNAKIANDVHIGPFCIVEGDVSIGKGTVLGPYCHVKGHTQIGENNQFFQGCIVGEQPQSKSYDNPTPALEIGDHNIFREFMTFHASMVTGNATKVGSHNFLMANSHIAHDCVLGDHITFSNYTGLSGHVVIEDRVFISGLSGVHQFAKVGTFAMVGGVSKVVKDVPPFAMTEGNPAYVVGMNRVGIRRGGLNEFESRAMKEAYKILYRSKLLVPQALERIENQLLPSLKDGAAIARVKHYLEFCQSSKLGIMANA